MSKSTSDLSNDIASEHLNRENEDKQVLALLLDKAIGKKDQVLVQKTEMGGSEAYIGSTTLEWFAGRVRFASALPLLQQKYNSQTDNVEIDAESIDEIQQRPLDWSRQLPLAQYLAVRKNHKFPPVLVVINQPWVDNPKAPEWDEKGRATKSTTEFTPLDKDGNLGLLNLCEENVTIYALDGQHRLMGVQGLMELLKTGELQRYKKDKSPDDTLITVSSLIEHYQLQPAYLESLPKEKIGIEFICAVAAGETRTEARRRVRSIFVHVNLMAAPLTKGQIVQLNEDDGFSIVARKIATTDPLFEQRPERHPRVNWNSGTIASKSTVLTTLQALKEMSERYLGQKFTHWKPLEKGLIPLRPEDEELEDGIQEFHKLFNYLSTLPSYKVLDYDDTPILRRFSFEKDGGEGNMLFRPVGQVALAQALGTLVFKKGFSLDDIFKKLYKFDQQGGFSGMEYPKSLWYGVLYDPNKKRIQVAGRDLATRLLIYILGGIQDNMERAQLRKDLATARTFENRTISFNGNFVEPQKVGLPAIL
ncbi:DGQHR domain-containing protein [Aetokthonos hydrillicola Thurmond2011]|uniref:DGQHR domain-containing protein n=1 Tax=Aetokthonos hydrillicola Thurmond2011 TaxID=2712845 RepID=A0AAP5MAR5_9CYAN|nr:DGQHR domain-containing protein [Aetokthonos hydrillicola]MBO3457748.1 DGQHR domain-containing protein [Aetokthonos hydrillicola CCALA 1050]MBW4589401.1 DGQHR domain-containing protein [Aetokthonos hydrillicola CCALA 1050]MDR9897122.1 DGQHR domain-containing protein [Aetokthonos hydrillicola Thurmond2011]